MIYDLADSLKWCGWVSYCNGLSVSSIQLGDPLGLPIDLGRGGEGSTFLITPSAAAPAGLGQEALADKQPLGVQPGCAGLRGGHLQPGKAGGGLPAQPAPLWALLPPGAGTGLLPGLAGYRVGTSPRSNHMELPGWLPSLQLSDVPWLLQARPGGGVTSSLHEKSCTASLGVKSISSQAILPPPRSLNKGGGRAREDRVLKLISTVF